MPTLPATRQKRTPGRTMRVDRNTLAQAFESFSHAAGSLETSYTLLQAETTRLRRELEGKNRDLARALAENERIRAFLGCVLEGLPSGVLVIDRDFKVRLANPAARCLAAASDGAPLAVGETVPEELRPRLERSLKDEQASEQTWSLETSEGARYVSATCASLADNASSGGELVFILRDTTEQRRLEKERESSRRMQALADMTAILAHEIRNPLGSLELFASLIRDATRDQTEVSQWTVHLQAGLRALSAMVDNVLHYHAAASPVTTPVDIVKFVLSTIDFLQPLALQRSMRIDFSSPSDVLWIRADTHRLQQVFFNLTINAFRAMVPGGILMIRIVPDRAASGRCVKLEFADHGAGICPEHLEKIFDPGFSTSQGSPGLGLAVSKRLVEQHGGTIQVRSTPGKGTTFTIVLPVIEVGE